MSDPITRPQPLPPRIQRIREAFFAVKPSISIHRALASTAAARECIAWPVVRAKAEGYYRACCAIPVAILPDELIVGHPGGRRRAGIFSPEIAYQWLERELDTVHQREQDPYDLSDEDKATLQRDIFPYWRGRSVEEAMLAELDALDIRPLTVGSGIIDCEVKSTSGGGDLAPGFPNVLFKKGFAGIREQALQRIEGLSLTDPDALDQRHFLWGVARCAEGMIRLAERYAEEAERQAAGCTDARRKAELERMAAVCRRVPAHPPTDLHEALQMIWFGMMAIALEENTSGTSPGRVDQYVYPFYRAALDGGMDPGEVRELLLCFLIKFNEVPWLLSSFATHYFAGYIPFFNLVVGGQDREGHDATNDLSYEIMDSVRDLQMYQPSLSARVYEGSPERFLRKIAELVSTGIGFPAVHFDDVTIRMLLSRGIGLADARDYCLMGCVEPYVQGKLSRWSSAVYTNFPIAIELALTDGVHRATGQQLGPHTGDPSGFERFEQFTTAVETQLCHILDVSTAATVVAQRLHQRLLPKPMSSSLVQGCVESGRGLMQGGAAYNSGPGVVMVGVADYANAMAAVQHLVFEEGSVSMTQLCRALADDFQGHEAIFRANDEAPKYGNDDDRADLFARDVIDLCSRELAQRRGLFSSLELGTLSVTTNIPQGEVIGALPGGRRAGQPLADGISPARGTDHRGPTAAIKSVDKINQVSSSSGTLYNMKLDPGLLADERGVNNFVALLRTHDQLGGAQIQFNCVTRDKLLDAQQHPEDYRTLMVRVSGYSAYFTELCREVQDDIIARSTQSRWG